MTTDEFIKEAERIRPSLLLTAQRYLEAEDAEDVVQDALLRLWNMRDELTPPMVSLARVVVRNLCLDRLRREKPLLRLDTHETEDPPDEEVGQWERIERLMTLIEALPTMQQTILRLRHIEGMEMSDIAEMTGSNEVALRKVLSRARQAVRLQFLKQNNP